MKNLLIKWILVVIVLSFGTDSFAQFAVAGLKGSKGEYCMTKLTEDDYKKLKKCITYFVCPQTLLKEREELQILLDEAWDYTDIVVIGNDEVKEYIKKKNSAFIDISILTNPTIQEIYMELAIVGEKRVRYARFNLNFNCKMAQVIKKDGTTELFKYFDTEADILNLKPGIIANYLKMIATKLNEKEFVDCQAKIKNAEELKNLEKDTLFITDNAKIKFLATAFKFGCETDEEVDVEKLMKRYPFPYQFVTFEELSNKIINGDEFYYAICLKTQDNLNHVSVYKSKTGECVYNSFSVGAQFVNGDFEKIAKLVKK